MAELFEKIGTFDKSLRSTSTIEKMWADAKASKEGIEKAALIAAAIILELYVQTKGRADLAEKLYPARLAEFC